MKWYIKRTIYSYTWVCYNSNKFSINSVQLYIAYISILVRYLTFIFPKRVYVIFWTRMLLFFPSNILKSLYLIQLGTPGLLYIFVVQGYHSCVFVKNAPVNLGTLWNAKWGTFLKIGFLKFTEILKKIDWYIFSSAHF